MRKIIFFFACAALLSVALDRAINLGMLRIRYGIYAAFNRVAQGTLNADLIITGSSRATLHYDPAPIAAATGLSTFNLGRIGSPVIVHRAVLRHYLAHNRAPRLLIENADLGSLTSFQPYNPVQYVPYLRDPAYSDLLIPRYFDLQDRHWSKPFDEFKRNHQSLIQQEDSLGIKDMADFFDDARAHGLAVILASPSCTSSTSIWCPICRKSKCIWRI